MAMSAMEAAAEAAAAKASARDHPDARRVEERALAVQAMADRAVAVLEEQLRTLITRKASEHSPRYSPRLSPTSPSLGDVRGVRRTSLSSPLYAFSFPRDYANTPESSTQQVSGNEQRQQYWVAAATEGSVTAPLVAAAILLMERAWSRRQSLNDSVENLRERAVALAVGEASAAAGSPAVSDGDGLKTAAVPINGNGNGSSSKSPLSSPPSSPSPPTEIGGLANLSCCVDFERILGEEDDTLPQEEILPLGGGDRAAAIGSSVLRTRDSLDKVNSDSSMIAERSFSGIDQHSGGGELLRFTGGVEAPSTCPNMDTWPSVFEDVAVVEERSREVVGIWEAAGGALKDTCEELSFEEADRSSTVRGLSAQ